MRWTVLLVAMVVAGFVAIHYSPVSSLQQDIAYLEAEMASAVSDLELLASEIERDDAILKTIFGEFDRSRPMLTLPVTVTCYTSRVKETDSTPHTTASGSLVSRGIVAVSRDLLSEVGLSYGQRVFLDGYGIFVVTDTMNSRHRRRVDIWTGDLKAAKLHGKNEQVAMMWVGN